MVLFWSFRVVFVGSVFHFDRFACFDPFILVVSFRSFSFVVSGFNRTFILGTENVERPTDSTSSLV